MAHDPEFGYRVVGTITAIQGTCNAQHKVGETFEISCHNTAGLCGFFYHKIFGHLATFQFGGNFPWWEGDTITVHCPDVKNLVSMKLERFKRS